MTVAPVGEGRVVVVIPTFRRLALLSVLLDGLVPQAAVCGALIIVGDNACDPAVARHIAERAGHGPVHYVPVPARGVSQVRNALVAEALRLAPGWHWLLMLDDDGQVTPGWLATMLDCADRHEPDLIGGPVIGVLPRGASRLARNSMFAYRKRWPTGPVDQLNTTQNLGIGRRLLDRLSLPLFSSRLGASGGEDYDLFRRTIVAGGKLVWCDEAHVLEPAPPERLTMHGLLHRYYTTGVYMAPIDAAFDGRMRGLAVAVKGLTGSTFLLLVRGLSGGLDKACVAALMIAHYTGRLVGLCGGRSSRYVQEEGGVG